VFAGDILAHIVGQGYEVSAAQAMTFDRNQAEEFLKVRLVRCMYCGSLCASE
jgi:nucleoside diphosphate kinase